MKLFILVYSCESQVASKKFIDDVSVLAFEQCLIDRLPSLFLPETIWDLTDDQVAQLAKESEALSSERIRCREKLVVLDEAKCDLKQLDIHRPSSLVGNTASLPQTRLAAPAKRKAGNDMTIAEEECVSTPAAIEVDPEMAPEEQPATPARLGDVASVFSSSHGTHKKRKGTHARY